MRLDSITIKDIAKALNLSYSTVSRALKDSYKISEETRRIVQEYADIHQYRPNLIAQSLKNKHSRSIGVVLCNIPNVFFAEVISGIESVAYNNDYLVIITQSQESYEREMKNVQNLTWRSVDGLLVSLSTESEDLSHFSKLHEQGLPIVFFDRVTDQLATHRVVADNRGGAYECTRHLIDSGYRKIAHITSSPHISITRERREGYEQALQEAGLAINETYIKYCMHGGMLPEEIGKAMDELLLLPDPPDALLCASDRLTMGCYSILRKKGLKIPDQMAIAGFSNFNSPELFCPSLTTIRQPAYEIGKTATELLLELIESKRPPTEFTKKIFPTELFIRDSTRKAGS
ncbi:MAG TPA: LacI family DNA-binding transcriptional regulator [Puia sp.]|nr:LacI family DNA-binding transcriptional regulator [Puia sp.]